MQVGALLANTRVNPVFQLLFRLPPLLFFPSHLFRALSLVSSRLLVASARAVESAKRRRAAVYRGRVTFMLARPSPLRPFSSLVPATRVRPDLAHSRISLVKFHIIPSYRTISRTYRISKRLGGSFLENFFN